MKRGKDDEKAIGPMFPRLHVNDTEKGGPRAPPRNKMALYEQLMIPSHRYNNHSGSGLPIGANPNDDVARAASTSQFQPLSVSPHAFAKPRFKSPDVANPSILAAGDDRTKKLVDEDDCAVPIFSKSELDLHTGKAHVRSTTTGEKEMHRDIEASKNTSGGSNRVKEVSNRDGKRFRDLMLNANQSTRSSLNLPEKDRSDGPSWQDSAKNQGPRTNNRVYRSNNTDVCIQRDNDPIALAAATSCADTVSSSPSKAIEKRSISMMGRISMGQAEGQPSDINSQSCRDETHAPLQRANMERGDDGSQTSAVDSISGSGITPDDVVGLIGLKHFWKARRAFVNQQRVFAVQVFELHRLIKVQKLIAESPDILLEGSAHVSKSSLKVSSVNRFSSDSGVVKPLAFATNQRYDSQKPHHRIEGTAENAVVAPVPSFQNPSQHLMDRPFSGNTASTAVTTETNIIPWCFPQPAGHQWLVPMMSPSDGLVYKPYPGPPAFMSPISGGFGPVGMTPLVSNFFSPYNFPAPQFQEGTSGPAGGPFHGQNYFPPYGMPVMNQVPASNSMIQNSPYQASCSIPAQKDGAVSTAIGKLASKGNERQGSTASSPGERAQSAGFSPVSRTADGLAVASRARSSRVSDESSQPRDSDQPSRVIRVVPRNPRSASESASRMSQILRSIQEERRQHEPN